MFFLFMEITQSDITFSNVNEPQASISAAPLAASKYEDSTDFASSPKIINCIDIDWNSAAVNLISEDDDTVTSSTSIDTTGELLSAIQKLSTNVANLADAMVTLTNGMDSVFSDEDE